MKLTQLLKRESCNKIAANVQPSNIRCLWRFADRFSASAIAKGLDLEIASQKLSDNQKLNIER
jgi:hypothetical protein